MELHIHCLVRVNVYANECKERFRESVLTLTEAIEHVRFR